MANTLPRYITHITVDGSARRFDYLVSVKQGDKAVRYVSVLLLCEGNEYQIPADASLRCNFKKPDGKTCYNAAARDGNRVLMELTNQMLAVPGKALADIEIATKDAQQILYSATFGVEIGPAVRDDEAILSSNEMGALDAKWAEFDRASADYEEAERLRAQAEQGRVTAEQARATAEQGRVTAEQARAAAEQGRVTAETARTEAENERKRAEAERVVAEQGRVTDEKKRSTEERSRQKKETERQEAELGRVKAEEMRDEKLAKKQDKLTGAADQLVGFGSDGAARAVSFGGRNLLLNSGVKVTNADYMLHSYELAEKPVIGQSYTFTVKCRIGDDREGLALYNSGGHVHFGAGSTIYLTDVREGIFQTTITWRNNNGDGQLADDSSLCIWAAPYTSESESTIEWAKLEKGTFSTRDWYPAPEDLQEKPSVGVFVPVYPNAGAHNSIYRGKDISDKLADKSLYTAISSGTFEDLYIGDYFDITISTDFRANENVRCLLAGFDVFWNCGNTGAHLLKHHAVIVPMNCFAVAARMNTTDDTEGAYAGSDMFLNTLPKYAAALKTVFGENLIKDGEFMSKAVDKTVPSMAGNGWTGASSAIGWFDNELRLMSEIEVYGSTVASSSYLDVYTAKTQLPLFRLAPNHIVCGLGGATYASTTTDKSWWLSAVASSTRFAYIDNYGIASAYGASNAFGVRPRWLIG